jgi:hypothetical protein
VVRGYYSGLDLYGVHLVRREEGPALRALDECLDIDHEVDATLKVSLLEKQVDLLLHLHDFFQRTCDSIKEALNRKDNGGVFAKLKLKVPVAEVVQSVRTIMTERVLTVLEVVEAFEQMQPIDSMEQDGLEQLLLEGGAGVATDVVHTSDTIQYSEAVGIRHSRVDDGEEKKVDSPDVDSARDAQINSPPDEADLLGAAPVQHSGEIRFSEPLVTMEGTSDALTVESHAAMARLASAQQILLRRSALFAEQSIAIHREAYRTDLVEPATLAIALMQRARVGERLFDGDAAMEYTEQAEVAAVRALGGGSQLAIGIMLEGLRLFVKYRLFDSADLQPITQKASNINKFIVQFSFTDVKLADKFTQKCAEYLSISTVAIREKEARIQRAEADAKLAAEREARRKVVEAQKGVGKKAKY